MPNRKRRPPEDIVRVSVVPQGLPPKAGSAAAQAEHKEDYDDVDTPELDTEDEEGDVAEEEVEADEVDADEGDPEPSNEVSKSWIFTQFDMEYKQKLSVMKVGDHDMKYLTFQVEKCPTTGKLHLQGFIRFSKAKSLQMLLGRKAKGKRSAKDGIIGSAGKGHVEVAVNIKACNDYCHKKETRVEDPVTIGALDGAGTRTDIRELIADIKKGLTDMDLLDKYGDFIGRCPSGFEKFISIARPPPKGEEVKLDLFKWQLKAKLEFAKPVQQRRIFVFSSEESGTGKTMFMQHIAHEFTVLEVNNYDLKEVLHNYNNHQIIWINIPRHGKLSKGLIRLLETLSDGGMKQSTKYQGKTKFIKSHIVVTTNSSIEEFEELLPKRVVGIDVSFDDAETKTKSRKRSKLESSDADTEIDGVECLIGAEEAEDGSGTAGSDSEDDTLSEPVRKRKPTAKRAAKNRVGKKRGR